MLKKHDRAKTANIEKEINYKAMTQYINIIFCCIILHSRVRNNNLYYFNGK